MKTSELTGTALDWAVAKAAEEMFGFYSGDFYVVGEDAPYHPSTNWAQGGPIIERERLSVVCQQGHPPFWSAGCPRAVYKGYGPAPLVAAMRCYVASKLGDEVEIPEELK